MRAEFEAGRKVEKGKKEEVKQVIQDLKVVKKVESKVEQVKKSNQIANLDIEDNVEVKVEENDILL